MRFGARLHTGAVFLVVLAAGALLGSALVQWRGPGGPSDAVPLQPQVDGRIKVEVLNAGGRRDMAKRATDLLRDRGFDVVYFGNAERFDQTASVVLDRVGRPDAARAVAEALGIESVRSEIDRNLYLEVTVRLGSGWEPALAPQPGAGSGAGPWWDPRRPRPEGSDTRGRRDGSE
ncbi:MAG TPA: LytR C-terminal domain-containing protein [Longimicrobiales bacterium]|nr:LytR C-terminal domain-containing protein [Longimicrobiales bacterium]